MNSPNLDLNRSTPTLDPSQEQLIRQLVQSLLTPAQPGECKCHWLDCSKTPVLLWKNGNTFTLKIATQKLVGFARKDKHGTEYWRFRNDEELNEVKSAKYEQVLVKDKKVQEVPNPPTEPKPEPKKDPEVEKVQLELGDNKEQDPETVQKFREKFGYANNSNPDQG